MCVGSATAGSWFSSQWRPYNEFETDRLHYLHHPLRATSSLKYIRPSLDLLQEIQQTGDIFFPARWMGSTLSGHRSPEAPNIVRAFIDGTPPSHPDRLRRIILSSANELFRASEHRALR